MTIDKQKLIEWLQSELAKTRGAETAARLEWMDYCLFLFEENYRDLERHAFYTQQQDVAVRMFSDSDYASKAQGTFVRHLHNFLVSAKSLVEHTRVSMRKWYADTDFLSRYQNKVTEFFKDDPLVSFIEDLRNYCAHKSPVGIITHHRLASEASSNESFIHKESLMEWGKMSSGGKEYLRRYDSDIPILEPVTSYRNKVVDFRRWLRSELEAYHAQDIYEAKWYVQAISLAEKGDVEGVLKSCGLSSASILG